jgi:hypothetical protein
MDLLSPWPNPNPSSGHRERAETSPRNQRRNQSLRRFSSLAFRYCVMGLGALGLFPWPALGGELPGLANLNRYEQREVWGLVALVNAAAFQIKRQGEMAFPAFRKPGRWFDPEDGRYLFIFDLAGNQVANPAFPEVEGLYLRRVEEGGHTWVLGSWMPRPPAKDQAWRQSLLPTVKFAP